MSKAITITSPSGVTLKTKNKYMDDDVAISLSEAENILASNIKKDVSILGVSGTYEGFIPSGSITISENGTYNVSAFAEATVSVPGLIPSGTLEISSNGVYDVGNYASASVNVPQISTLPTIDGLCNGAYSEITLHASSATTPLFYHDSTVKRVTVENLTVVPASFCNNASIEFFSGPLVTTIGISALATCNYLQEAYLPNLKRVEYSAFAYTAGIGIEDFNYSNFEYVGVYAFAGTKSISATFLEFTNCISFNGLALYNVRQSSSIYFSFPKLQVLFNQLSFGYIPNSSAVAGFYAPKLEFAGGELYYYYYHCPTTLLGSVVGLGGRINQFGSLGFVSIGGGTRISVGGSAFFYNCKVSSFYVNSIEPPKITQTNDSTLISSYVQNIYVPSQCLEEYKAATNWTLRASDIQTFDTGDVVKAVAKDVASGTSISISINCVVGDNLVLCVTYRAGTITAPEWTQVYESSNYYNGGTQKNIIFIKTAEAAVETASITTNASGRIYAAICNIGTKVASVVPDMCYTQYGNIPATGKTITKSTDNPVLFLLGKVSYEGNGTATGWTFDAYHGLGLSGTFEKQYAWGTDYRAKLMYCTISKNSTAMIIPSYYNIQYGDTTFKSTPSNFGITALELSEHSE